MENRTSRRINFPIKRLQRNIGHKKWYNKVHWLETG